jgi:hypothetical protein
MSLDIKILHFKVFVNLCDLKKGASSNPAQARWTLCDKVCKWLTAGRWFSPGTPVSSTNKTDCHDITEILLKVVLNTLTP